MHDIPWFSCLSSFLRLVELLDLTAEPRLGGTYCAVTQHSYQKAEHRRAYTCDGFTCLPLASLKLLSLTCLPHAATQGTTSFISLLRLASLSSRQQQPFTPITHPRLRQRRLPLTTAFSAATSQHQASKHRSIEASNDGPIQSRHQGHLSAEDPD